MLIRRIRLPRSTIGEEIRNENVTPSGSPALVKPINSGMDEQEQKGVTARQAGEDTQQALDVLGAQVFYTPAGTVWLQSDGTNLLPAGQ